ncbi:uroporphyrinogen-III synthase [Sulfurihydrogenibium sp.]|jgi:uroporphyrinogen-III synthase|uniref:uroporphyrinogen-III synthase n=1 Tax=Sulfurihydrogenibium sp. TaxID=2053621 RepID=UPI002623C74F|nr:uroporphyrinogen-III synthase [Sulfurihydrogenibium sp.]
MKNIIITREASGFEEVKDLFINAGFNPISFPLIRFEPVEIKNFNLEDYEYLIFTSKNAVRYFFSQIPKIDKKIIAVGEKTAKYLENLGYKDIIVPEVYSAEGLKVYFEKNIDTFKDKKMALIRASEGMDTLLNSNFKIDLIPVYETKLNVPENVDNIKSLIEDEKIYAIAFSSPSTFKGFLNIFKEESKKLLDKMLTVAIGKTTKNFIESQGFKVDVVPDKFTFEEIVKKLKVMGKD